MSGARCVLFDLDGTLIDTAPSIAHAVNLMLAEKRLPTYAPETVRGWIGGGMERLVTRVLEALSASGHEIVLADALTAFRHHYGANLTLGSRPYPRIGALLARLERDGIALGCVTNKPREFAAPLLVELGLAPRFGVLVCGDDLASVKPDPAPVRAALSALGAAAEASWLVGDSLADVTAARGAGSRAVLVDWGYGGGDARAAAEADARVATVAELQDLLYPR